MMKTEVPEKLEHLQSVRLARISAEQTLPLRQSVLHPEKSLSQLCLPEDASGTHYGAFLASRDDPVAVISLFLEDIPIDIDKETGAGYEAHRKRAVRLRKFACAAQLQGRGIGTKLLLDSLSKARREMDATIAWCDARTSAREWYMRRGLIPFGTEFSKGSVEYVRMNIDLKEMLQPDEKRQTR